MNHKQNRKTPLDHFPSFEPPSSPPIKFLRKIKTTKQMTAQIKNTITENARGPALTIYALPNVA